MNRRYHAIYFEISGLCNARCAYCHSGTNQPVKPRFVTPDNFHRILSRLLENDVIKPKAVVSLYNWGEPTLHPKLNSLITTINALGLRYALSTNASKVPSIDEAFVKNLDHIIFSMPGFSQASYDRIHGFRFSDIKHNIIRIAEDCRLHGFKGYFTISYHVYRFNTHEIAACEHFANQHRLLFNPYYAILNNWWEINQYITGSLPQERKAAAERDLFTLEYLRHVTENESKSPYQCPQINYLNIDENGQIVTCCQIARDHPDYSCGNAITNDITSTLKRRAQMPVCASCIRSGLAYYLNTVLTTPAFYHPSIRQRYMKLKREVSRMSINRIGSFLKKLLR